MGIQHLLKLLPKPEPGGDVFTTELNETAAPIDATLKQLLHHHGRLRAGDRLGDGRYMLVRQLSAAPSTSVWMTHDLRWHDRVAVKVLGPVSDVADARRQAFGLGARQMARLDHRSVVRVRDPGGEDDGYQYFVMEYVEGEHSATQWRTARSRRTR